MRISQPEPGNVLRITGNLDIGAAEPLHHALREALTLEPSVTLDLSEVGACDTAALQLLYAARRSAWQCHKSFRIKAMSPAVREAGEALGLFLTELETDPGGRGDPRAV